MIFLYCIQETDKPKKIRKIFNIVELEQNRVILPITKSEIENGKLSQKKAQILAKNIVNKLKNAIGNNVILSKEIKKYIIEKQGMTHEQKNSFYIKLHNK